MKGVFNMKFNLKPKTTLQPKNYTGLKIAAIYGSIFLGAGFASGQELMQYFAYFGRLGLFGIMIAGLLFAFTGWAVLRICKREGLENYHQLMCYLFGPKFGKLMECMVSIFLFCLLVAMLAGAGATGHEAFGFSFSLSALITALLVFLVLCFGLNGIVKINLYLAPFMLLGGIFIGLFSFFTYARPVFAILSAGTLTIAWILSAVIYASYNLVTGVPILAAVSKIATTKKDAMIGGLLGGGIITLVGICMVLPIFLHYTTVVRLEIPFLYIAAYHGDIFRLFYLAVLISAIITTAACNAFAVSEWLKAQGFSGRIKIAAGICIAALVFSHIGFSNIVAYVYPAFGFLGLFKIIVVLWHGFCYTKASS